MKVDLFNILYYFIDILLISIFEISIIKFTAFVAVIYLVFFSLLFILI